MTTVATRRRYDLDWLRVIAFGLLILYHVGMFYVTWGWHVKSAHASPALEPLMRLVNPWRLALLFLISGIAIRYATDKAASRWRFAGQRVVRLGLPLLFGLYAWVMPQAYFQLRQSGEFTGSIADFYPAYVAFEQAFSIITPTWNHLWYLAYVLVYILLILPFLPWLRRLADSRAWRTVTSRPFVVVFLLILPFAANEAWLSPRFPTTHALVDDWAQHGHRFLIFLVGFLVAKDPGFWRTVERVWKPALLLAVVAWIMLQNAPAVASLAGRWLPGPVLHVLFSYIGTVYAWSCILALLGLAQRYLDHPGPVLRFLTGAIFCYYVLHQTITVVAGYYLRQLDLGVVAESTLLLGITVLGCVAGYELLRRIPGIRILFGVHPVSGYLPATSASSSARALR